MTDPAGVLNYILFDFVPALMIPFTAGILLIGLLTRFIKRGMEI